MLVDGCAAGPLRIDCGPLLALASSILTLQIKVASHDPKVSIMLNVEEFHVASTKT